MKTTIWITTDDGQEFDIQIDDDDEPNSPILGNIIRTAIYDRIGNQGWMFAYNQTDIPNLHTIDGIVSYMSAIYEYDEETVREFCKYFEDPEDILSYIYDYYATRGDKRNIIDYIVENDIRENMCGSCWNEVSSMISDDAIWDRYLEYGQYKVIEMGPNDYLLIKEE